MFDGNCCNHSTVVPSAYPVTTAGPKALAGLMQFELMGPVIHMLKVMPRAIAKGASLPQPLHTHTFGHNSTDMHCTSAVDCSLARHMSKLVCNCTARSARLALWAEPGVTLLGTAHAATSAFECHPYSHSCLAPKTTRQCLLGSIREVQLKRCKYMPSQEPGPYFLLFTSPMITHMKKKDAIPSPKKACSNSAICVCVLLDAVDRHQEHMCL